MSPLHKCLSACLALPLAALLGACDGPPQAPPAERPGASMGGAPWAVPRAAEPEVDPQTDLLAQTRSGKPIHEAELSLPLYPGATLLQAQSFRVRSETGLTVTGTFDVDATPALVAAFYRDQMRSRSSAEPFMEQRDADRLTLMQIDNSNDTAVQVQISPAGRASHVELTATEFTPR